MINIYMILALHRLSNTILKICQKNIIYAYDET